MDSSRFSSVVMSIRDKLRRIGITGKDALMVIVCVISVKEFDRFHPECRDEKNYNEIELKSFYELETFGPQIIKNGFKWVEKTKSNSPFVNIEKLMEGFSEINLPEIRNKVETIKRQLAILKRLDGGNESLWNIFETINSSFSFNDNQGDLMGDLYMEIIRKFCDDGGELGEFFTPKNVIDAAITYAMEDEKGERKLGTLMDPTCGTGGFLVEALKRKICDNIIYGFELNANTHMIAQSNVIIHGGNADNVLCQDFLNAPIKRKFDTILANPPYGVKGIVYASLSNKKDYFPIKSSSTNLFLQKIIYCLNVGGRGCVVLPAGSGLDRKNKSDVELRKRLFSCLNIRYVVNVPAGSFMSTDIPTIILCFDKVRELNEPDGNMSTQSLKFRTLDNKEIEGVPSEIDIKVCEDRKWCLSSGSYEEAKENVISSFPLYRLGDIVELHKGKVPASKVISGPYPVISIGEGKTHNITTDEGEVLTISNTNASKKIFISKIKYFSGKCAITSLMSRIVPNVEINIKYLYYLLLSKKDIINNCWKGLANKTLDKDKFNEIIVPLPPSEIQSSIVSEMDELQNSITIKKQSLKGTIKNISVYIANILYKKCYLGYLLKDRQIKEDFDTRNLGDIVELRKGKVQASKVVPGPYPVISIGDGKTHNEATDEGEVLAIADGSGGFNLVYHNGPCCITTLMDRIIPTVEINAKYLYYFLDFKYEELEIMKDGLTNRSLDKDKFNGIIVPLPPSEIQNEIIEHLNVLYDLKTAQEWEISLAERQMNLLIESFLS